MARDPPQLENEKRLDSIVSYLKSTDKIDSGLKIIESSLAEISQKILPSLVEETNELRILNQESMGGEKYELMLTELVKIELIFTSPSTIDENIKNPDYFDRCLKTLELFQKLYDNHAHELPLINKLNERSMALRDQLMRYSCHKLEVVENIPIKELESIILNMKICGQPSDEDVKLGYLQARDNWFNNSCERQGATFDNVVEVHCNGIPLIFNEYKEIFPQDDFVVINSWLHQKASIFISSLEDYLKLIREKDIKTPAMIGDTIEKCFQLGNWLSSIGFDFSSRLRPLFVKAILEEVKLSLIEATENFESNFTNTVNKSIESILLPVDDEILKMPGAKSDSQFPKSLSHYPVFHVYALNALDSLRWLHLGKGFISSINLCFKTYEALNLSLSRVIKALSLVMSMDDNLNNIHLTKVAIVLVTEFLPYIINHCNQLFPERLTLSALGISKSEFNDLMNNDPKQFRGFMIDVKSICEPLKIVMPSLFDTIISSQVA